jgi:hypothetical protein
MDETQLAKLLEQVASAATAKATLVGAVAGKEEALKIDLVSIILSMWFNREANLFLPHLSGVAWN